MSLAVPRFAAALFLVCAFVAHAANPPSSPPVSELDTALQAANATHQKGPAEIALRDQAHLKLPAGYAWVPQAAAGQLLKAMGNRVDDRLIGVVLPQTDANWLVVVQFAREGYIKDDEAKDWNADELLKSLREGTEQTNVDRTQRGIPPIEVEGWAQKPQYDADTHRLVWSILSHNKGQNTGERSVNYNTYALGREGYISLNLVTTQQDLAKYKPDALALLSALQYDPGKRYADFNSSTDKVAAYGLTALVAGAAAKKLGLLAALFAFLAKFAKVIVVALGAGSWGLTKMFRKKSDSPTVAASARPTEPSSPPALPPEH